MFDFVMLFLFFSVLFTGIYCQGGPPEGEVEYALILESPIYVCPDEESLSFIDTSKVQTVRYNETISFMLGHIIFLKEFSTCTMVEIVLYKKANGRMEVVMSLEICDVCSEIRKEDSNYKNYMKAFGFPEACPFEPGEYEIHEMSADTSELPVNSANCGQYQATLTLYDSCECDDDDKKFIACMNLDCAIEPV